LKIAQNMSSNVSYSKCSLTYCLTLEEPLILSWHSNEKERRY